MGNRSSIVHEVPRLATILSGSYRNVVLVRRWRYDVIDIEAPVLGAFEAKYRGVVRWFVWCQHCQIWHDHGPAEGHREAHCQEWTSPYWKNGHNLAYAGRWRDRPKASP